MFVDLVLRQNYKYTYIVWYVDKYIYISAAGIVISIFTAASITICIDTATIIAIIIGTNTSIAMSSSIAISSSN